MTATPKAQYGRHGRGQTLQRQEKQKRQQCYASDADEHGGECKQWMAASQSVL
jgi:hypothetical protein